MRLIQFYILKKGPRVGLIDGDAVYDLTDLNPKWDRIYHIFFDARRVGKQLNNISLILLFPPVLRL